MNRIELEANSASGIAGCVNCTGIHPDKILTIRDCWNRMTAPQKEALMVQAQFEQKRHLYMNKSCSICGRTYDASGNLDESWKMTARRVAEEMQHAGIFGLDEKKIEWIVAQCRKNVETLFKNRMQLVAFARETGDWGPMERMTFSGTLAVIITNAQAARASKNGTLDRSALKGKLV